MAKKETIAEVKPVIKADNTIKDGLIATLEGSVKGVHKVSPEDINAVLNYLKSL